ncbi:unnamed protein product [Brassicogethes aeneus]|uniref:RNA (guanine-9-)-methyltransferase domain-containing protein 1 n=1 Tax=Brassicogethes aeneus TaxID=1431903 RepID=A0A9P0B554_BRAAE|nr:unnamed protein product [Brassicogethes aeneus]
MFIITRNCRRFIKLHKHITTFPSIGNDKFQLTCKNINQTRCLSQNAPNVNTNNYETKEEDENYEINYEAIANGDKMLEHKIKVIALEVEVMRQEGKNVPPPSFFTDEHWREAANLPTRTARRRLFDFLFKTLKKKENEKIKKEKKKLERDNKPEHKKCETFEEFASTYDLAHNNLFLRFYDTTINQLYNNKLVQAMRFGQKLVIDCGFDKNMSKRENINCAKQFQFLFAENRLHKDPYDIHYCNLGQNSVLREYFERQIPTLYESWFPINVHETSYLDKFAKEQLVYLTPHCREELEYSHDDVYIIGGIVDKINNEPLSLAKAKREGLRMAKLPLDKYLQWGSGSGKSLTLNQMILILNDVKTTGDWKYALRHVPKRKIAEFYISKNIQGSTDNLRFDRIRREKKWVPATNIDFNNLRFNKKNDNGKSKLKTSLRSIFNDE